MSIEEILPTVVLIAVVYLLIRWFNKSGPATTAEGGIRGVTLSMVETVNSTFPDIPAPNIIYSLSRTRSVQATSEEILERGFLSAPPATFTVPPSLLPPSATAPVTTGTDTTQIHAKSSTPTKTQSLIERYGLGTRLPSLKGKEKEDSAAPSQDHNLSPESNSKSGEKNTWADTKERREQELKARKERVILEARKRMLEKQAKLSHVSS